MKGYFTTFGFAALLCMVSGTVAQAQAPLLAVTAPQPQGKGFVVLVTNHYSSPVTAYALQAGERHSKGGNGRWIKWEDQIPASIPNQIRLGPGQTEAISTGAMGQPVRSAAVIYADGATAGDADLIAHFLRVRQYLLAELPSTIAMLRSAASSQSATRAALVGSFQSRATAGRSALLDGVLGPMDRVSDTVVMNFSDPNLAEQSVAATANSLANMFTRWQAELEASLPSPAVQTGTLARPRK